MSLRQASLRLGISRKAATKWLSEPEMVEPKYPVRQVSASVLDPFKEQLVTWLKADSHRNKREQRGIKALFEALRAMGYGGSSTPVYRFARRWKLEQSHAPKNVGFVPLHFELGEAFQFDWSCEYAFIGGLRRRLEVAHIKLATSRAFLLVAYSTQTHEMLFDAHARGFAVFGGVPKRGIYYNMKTAVDKIGKGKQRSINARFEAMTGHYLFDPEFCNCAAGWEKGIVEKNVQDRRRGVVREITERRWSTLAELNDWLQRACQDVWQELAHPEWPALSIADVWQDEASRLMPCPKPFEGYVEQPIRVTSKSLIQYQRNRYSVPCEWVHGVVSLRVYPEHLLVVGFDGHSPRSNQLLPESRHFLCFIGRPTESVLQLPDLPPDLPIKNTSGGYRQLPLNFYALGGSWVHSFPWCPRSLALSPYHSIDSALLQSILALRSLFPTLAFPRPLWRGQQRNYLRQTRLKCCLCALVLVYPPPLRETNPPIDALPENIVNKILRCV